VFGGSFDPIHNGHLRMAEVARESIGLDRVLFVPNRVSPFKTARAVTPGPLRAEMVRQAVSDNPAFAVSEIELERPGPSYTVDTVVALAEEFAGAELFFLTGTDAIRDLRGWHRPEDLLRMARFVALTRPGVDVDEVRAALPAEWTERIRFVAMPLLEISSTDLRTRLRDGRSVRYLMPPGVESFVRDRGLYRDEPGGDAPLNQGATK
jgi:nicotinate-nucleotide adenylyltransferase